VCSLKIVRLVQAILRLFSTARPKWSKWKLLEEKSVRAVKKSLSWAQKIWKMSEADSP